MRSSFLFAAAFAVAAIATPVERSVEDDSSANDVGTTALTGNPLPFFPKPINRHNKTSDDVEDTDDVLEEGDETPEEVADLDKRESNGEVRRDEDSSASITTVISTSTDEPTSSTIIVTSSVRNPNNKRYATSTKKSSTKKSTTSTKATPTWTYKQAVLNHHNIHRRNHSAPDLVWSTALEDSAKKWALKCIWAHNTTINGGGYGQNIAAGVSKSAVGVVVSDLWYNNEMPYFAGQYGKSQPNMDSFEKWGHFTQVVWKQTSKVGCYTAPCSQGMSNVNGRYTSFTVCNYGPPGNFLGNFNKGVGKPLGHARVKGTNNSFKLSAYKSY